MKKKKNIITPPLAVFPVNVKKQADELGTKYQTISAELASIVSESEKVKTDIKDLAAKLGIDEQGKKVVRGDAYAVGYSVGTDNYSVDLSLAKAILPTSVLRKILFESVNEKAFSALVESGEIDPKTAKRLLVKTGVSANRLYIKEVK